MAPFWWCLAYVVVLSRAQSHFASNCARSDVHRSGAHCVLALKKFAGRVTKLVRLRGVSLYCLYNKYELASHSMFRVSKRVPSVALLYDCIDPLSSSYDILRNLSFFVFVETARPHVKRTSVFGAWLCMFSAGTLCLLTSISFRMQTWCTYT